MAPQPNGLVPAGHHHHHGPLSAVVIGMGPAGMGAALSLTALGFRVHVVERDNLTDQGAGAASTPSQVCIYVALLLRGYCFKAPFLVRLRKDRPAVVDSGC